MLKFISDEFKSELIECLRYAYEKQNKVSGLNIDFYNLLDESFDPGEFDDLLIDGSHIISICPEDNEEEYYLSLDEFIEIINESKESCIIDKVMCISNNKALVRVSPRNYEDFESIRILLDNQTKDTGILKIECAQENRMISCSLVDGITLFGMLVHFSNDFDKYNPSFVPDEYFVKIIIDDRLDKNSVDIIFDSYVFEVFSTHGIKIYRNPRPDFTYEGFDSFEISRKEYTLRPLLFGKGINELIKLFNDAEEGFVNYNYAIMQYTKVLEFVSQTVIRQEITTKAQNKLMSSRALNPDANYIKEIENLFLDFKQKYDTDRNAIKVTIRTCCDIFEIVDHAPKYLDRIIKLKENLLKEKSDKEKLVDSAFDLLTDSISDTRNFLAHAKANYTLKGKECPDEQKEYFVNMLKILSTQAIRWFALTNESARVLPVND